MSRECRHILESVQLRLAQTCPLPTFRTFTQRVSVRGVDDASNLNAAAHRKELNRPCVDLPRPEQRGRRVVTPHSHAS